MCGKPDLGRRVPQCELARPWPRHGGRSVPAGQLLHVAGADKQPRCSKSGDRRWRCQVRAMAGLASAFRARSLKPLTSIADTINKRFSLYVRQVVALPGEEYGLLWADYITAMAACLLHLRDGGSDSAEASSAEQRLVSCTAHEEARPLRRPHAMFCRLYELCIGGKPGLEAARLSPPQGTYVACKLTAIFPGADAR